MINRVPFPGVDSNSSRSTQRRMLDRPIPAKAILRTSARRLTSPLQRQADIRDARPAIGHLHQNAVGSICHPDDATFRGMDDQIHFGFVDGDATLPGSCGLAPASIRPVLCCWSLSAF